MITKRKDRYQISEISQLLQPDFQAIGKAQPSYYVIYSRALPYSYREEGRGQRYVDAVHLSEIRGLLGLPATAGR
jgi:hypothetical protein